MYHLFERKKINKALITYWIIKSDFTYQEWHALSPQDLKIAVNELYKIVGLDFSYIHCDNALINITDWLVQNHPGINLDKETNHKKIYHVSIKNLTSLSSQQNIPGPLSVATILNQPMYGFFIFEDLQNPFAESAIIVQYDISYAESVKLSYKENIDIFNFAKQSARNAINNVLGMSRAGKKKCFGAYSNRVACLNAIGKVSSSNDINISVVHLITTPGVVPGYPKVASINSVPQPTPLIQTPMMVGSLQGFSKLQKSNGETCPKCKEFYPYADSGFSGKNMCHSCTLWS